MLIKKEKFEYLWKDPLFSSPFTWDKFRRILAIVTAEVIGTGTFMNLGCASLINTPLVTASVNFFEIVVAFIFGIGLAVMIAFPVSGSVLNPSLSFALIILGHFSIYRWILYTLSQLLGASLGIGLNALIVPDTPGDYCVSEHPPEMSAGLSFFYEILYTFVLCWGLCALIDKRRVAYLGYFVDVKFAIVLLPLILNITKLYGTTVNPSKAFGGAIGGLNFTQFWIYFLGPYIGSSTLAILYRLMMDSYIQDKSGVKPKPDYSPKED